jgi:hypothetical protein
MDFNFVYNLPVSELKEWLEEFIELQETQKNG